MLRAAILVIATVLIATGGFRVISGASSGDSPQPNPAPVPAASIVPNGGEPAWTHVCLGTDDEPAWCENI